MSEGVAVNNFNVSILTNKESVQQNVQSFDPNLNQIPQAQIPEAQISAAQIHPTQIQPAQIPAVQIQVAEHIEALQPYKPGRPPTELMKELGIDRLVNLASNENSYPPPESVLKAISDTMVNLNRYPDAGGLLLKTRLAEKYNLKPENVCLGAGSESILGSTIRAFLHGDEELLTSQGTFIGLYVLANAKGAKLQTVPLKDYAFDLDAILGAVSSKTKIIYLCNPNNPSGTIFNRVQFEHFIARVPQNVLVIVDEAYHEFAESNLDFPSTVDYKLPNVLTLRTFSKAYAMAGIRVGYGFGDEKVIGYINRVKLPFEPNILAQAAGLAALGDSKFPVVTQNNNREGIHSLSTAFAEMRLKYVPSHANFILIDLHSEANALDFTDKILKKGIAIRHLKAFGLPTCVRVTIGLPEENEKLVQALKLLV